MRVEQASYYWWNWRRTTIFSGDKANRVVTIDQVDVARAAKASDRRRSFERVVLTIK